jgi:hypothetical protein
VRRSPYRIVPRQRPANTAESRTQLVAHVIVWPSRPAVVARCATQPLRCHSDLQPGACSLHPKVPHGRDPPGLKQTQTSPGQGHLSATRASTHRPAHEEPGGELSRVTARVAPVVTTGHRKVETNPASGHIDRGGRRTPAADVPGKGPRARSARRVVGPRSRG